MTIDLLDRTDDVLEFRVPIERSAIVLHFSAISGADVAVAGGKGASLGAMQAAGFPVPPGFVVTTGAFDEFAAHARLRDAIDRECDAIDVDDAAALHAAARRLHALIMDAPVPVSIGRAISEAYAALCGPGEAVRVAVRSSAPAEDSADNSFAGMFETFLNVAGVEAIVDHVRMCWASAFTPRALYYRSRRRVGGDVSLAVVVQRMVDAEKSGVLFSVNPTGNAAQMLIEAAWGLGEAVVQGAVTPDQYVVDRRTAAVASVTCGAKQLLVRWDPEAAATVTVNLTGHAKENTRVLADGELSELVAIARRAERLYGGPQDIEFAVADGHLWLTQCRPMTTPVPAAAPATAPAAAPEPNGAVATRITGIGASPGRATGTVRILATPSDGAALLAGDVLVTRMTTPDWVPLMQRAGAIVTDAGGVTSHAAIVARELGVPAVVGTRIATSELPAGVMALVDGSAGVVTTGMTAVPAMPGTRPGADASSAAVGAARGPSRQARPPVTATKVYVNLADPERAAEVAERDVDGVGLLRAEFMMLRALERLHPRAFLERHGADAFVERMRDQLTTFGLAFGTRPVIYRAMDFRSNEYRNLEGGEAHEPVEENPMIGYRGSARYAAEPDLFLLELRAIAECRRAAPNVHLMIPFVRSERDLAQTLALVDRSALGDDRRLKRWIMAEVPSVLQALPAYAKLGIDGVSIGSNDLTQLMLGIDRDGERVASLWDECDPAVLWAVERIVTTCRSVGLTCSICGQAPSIHPDYAERLVRWGIDSISVEVESIERTRWSVACAERRLLLDAARGGE